MISYLYQRGDFYATTTCASPFFRPTFERGFTAGLRVESFGFLSIEEGFGGRVSQYGRDSGEGGGADFEGGREGGGIVGLSDFDDLSVVVSDS